MAFLFGTKKIDTPEPKLAGLGPEETTTNEQARPLPWMAGSARIPVTWMAPAYNVRTVALKRKVGKKSTTVGYNYYAGVAGLVCSGPVDKITQIWMNRELVWEGSVTRSSTDYATITIETRGQFRIYWGTTTQDTDDLLLDSVADAHVPYRRQCYIVCPDLFWGENVTTAPTIEVVIHRHPVPSWGSELAELNDDHNPAYAIAELLQDPVFGLGMADSRIDTASFEAIADDFATADIGLSPVINRQQTLREVIRQFSEHCDVWVSSSTSGKIALKKPEAYSNISEVTLIAETSLEEAPQLENGGWDDVITTTWLRYNNKAGDFKEDAVAFRDQGALAITASQKTQTIQRPWITRNEVAEVVVSKTGRLAAVPSYSGRVSMTDTAAADVALGGLFRFGWTESGLSNVVGIIDSITIPGPGEKFWQVEFSEWHNDLYTDNASAIGVVTPVDETEIEVSDVYAKLATELPLGLTSTNNITYVPLVARGDSLTTACNIWLKKGTTYDQITQIQAFALRGKLTQNFAGHGAIFDDTGNLRILVESPEKTIEAQTYEQAQYNTLLMIVNPGGESEEIMSIEFAGIVATNTYSFAVIRSRYDTRRIAHAINSPVWIIERALISEIYDSNIIEVGETYDLKYQAVLGNQEFDLASVTAATTTEARARQNIVQAPIHSKINGFDFLGTYDSLTEDLVITWDYPDGHISGDVFELKFYDQAESTLYHTATTTSNTLTLTNADVITHYGSHPVSVIVHLRASRDSVFSTFTDRVKIDKE